MGNRRRKGELAAECARERGKRENGERERTEKGRERERKFFFRQISVAVHCFFFFLPPPNSSSRALPTKNPVTPNMSAAPALRVAAPAVAPRLASLLVRLSFWRDKGVSRRRPEPRVTRSLLLPLLAAQCTLIRRQSQHSHVSSRPPILTRDTGLHIARAPADRC